MHATYLGRHGLSQAGLLCQTVAAAWTDCELGYMIMAANEIGLGEHTDRGGCHVCVGKDRKG